ncbi:MAG: inorganic diphosphatase [Gammaproteobacteria bacterium]|nr:inorganic diphosphatase [Gammaproteobacteria bacterium]
MKKLLFLMCLLNATACVADKQSNAADEIATPANILFDYPTVVQPGLVNLLVEIPAGTQQKWEAMKSGDGLKWDRKNGQLRVINYLPYPGNYGMIPRTLLPREAGGDGDPLDVIMLGSSVPRATVIAVKPIAVLRLLDNGEQDDKILAVPLEGAMSDLSSLAELNQRYAGVTQIIELWFTHYKGSGRMESQGYADKDAAWEMINIASRAFDAKHSD